MILHFYTLNTLNIYISLVENKIQVNTVETYSRTPRLLNYLPECLRKTYSTLVVIVNFLTPATR